MSVAKLWALIVLGAMLTIVGDTYLKRSHGLDRLGDLGLGLCFYMLGCVPVIFAFKQADFSVVFIVWESVTLVIAIGIGRILFGEAVTLDRLLAVALAIAALILSARGG
jgi:multidrug transporter EmrE-like cation transporter